MDIYTPKNTKQIIAIWAVISEDEGGDGLLGGIVGNIATPLITADADRVEQLIEHARKLVEANLVGGKRIKLIKLAAREEVMEISGRDRQPRGETDVK